MLLCGMGLLVVAVVGVTVDGSPEPAWVMWILGVIGVLTAISGARLYAKAS